MSGVFNSRDRERLGEVCPVTSGIRSCGRTVKGLSSRRLGSGAERFGGHLRSKTALSSVLPRTFTAMERTTGHILNVRRCEMRVVNNVVLRRKHVTRVQANRNGALISALPTCLGTLRNGNIYVIAIGSCLTGHSTR